MDQLKLTNTVHVCLFLLLLLFRAPRLDAASIGIYSGTFDPLHAGHIDVARKSAEHLKLDKIYILPNYSPANKPDSTPFSIRYRSVQLLQKRIPIVEVLEKSFFERAFQQDPIDCTGVLIRDIIRREGPKNSFFHICGTDAFNKMQEYGKLPKPQENRTVAVSERGGYLAKLGPEAVRLQRIGKVRFLDLQTRTISSTMLRKKIQDGVEPSPDELPPFMLRFVQRNRLYNCRPPRIEIPSGYKPRLISREPASRVRFSRQAVSDVFPAATLRSPLLLDFDRYIDEKFPKQILDLVVSRAIPVTILASLREDAFRYLASQDYDELISFVPVDETRIQLAYVLARKGRALSLFVTDLFGSDRLKHVALEFAWLLSNHLLPLEHLTILKSEQFDQISERVCQESFKSLPRAEGAVVFMGYRGALAHVAADFSRFFQEQRSGSRAPLSGEVLDRIHEKYKNSPAEKSTPLGNKYFPYWEGSLGGSRRRFRYIAFRNLYGDQTAVAIEQLVKRGFKTFVLFGNGGSLGSAQIGKVYAPTEFHSGKEILKIENRASEDYPAKVVVPVDSILEETAEWIKTNRRFDLVEVENSEAARVLSGHRTLMYSGVLVSDRPGDKDISEKDEDSAAFLRAKREFFFRAIHKLGLQEADVK